MSSKKEKLKYIKYRKRRLKNLKKEINIIKSLKGEELYLFEELMIENKKKLKNIVKAMLYR